MKDRVVLGVKGLAIIGVAFHHVMNRRLDPHTAEWVSSLNILFNWCVLAFFFVSGFLQGLSDSRKTRTAGEFALNRVKRLLIPFVLLILFYSSLWQLSQALGIANIAVKIPRDFLGKVLAALWPVDSQVSEQLYYLILLFGISIILMMIRKSLGLWGIWGASVITLGIGLDYFSASFTGFTIGVFTWGIFFYSLGYLLFHYRENKAGIRFGLVALTLTFILLNGYSGVIRCLPLWLLAEGTLLKLDRLPILDRLGEASGTIYIYHTPFVLQPLIILATCLTSALAQFIGILLAAFVAIGLCYLLFEMLKNTRARILLM